MSSNPFTETENEHGKIVSVGTDYEVYECQRCGKWATAERALAKTKCDVADSRSASAAQPESAVDSGDPDHDTTYDVE